MRASLKRPLLIALCVFLAAAFLATCYVVHEMNKAADSGAAVGDDFSKIRVH